MRNLSYDKMQRITFIVSVFEKEKKNEYRKILTFDLSSKLLC